nr:unnamed protein product [Callosobruchus analis]
MYRQHVRQKKNSPP